MNRSLYVCLRGAVIMAALGFLNARPAEANDTKSCIADVHDKDKDGYAAEGAPDSDVRVSSRDLRCPKGYVDKAGDCDDHNPAIHPRTSEIGFNRKDDNCNGLIDEPTFVYDAGGIGNRPNSIDVVFGLNHHEIREAALQGKLEITARPVRLATFDTYTDRHFTARDIHLALAAGLHSRRITLDSLNSATVWAVRLFFYRKEGSALVNIGPNGDLKGDGTGSKVDTEWYYTMTDSHSALPHKRFRTVMRGLAEYAASQVGEVGYRGTIRSDGKRYSADGNEKWCSEFYVWVTKPFLRGIGGSTVDDLREYFRDRDAIHPASLIPTDAQPGDYLPLDSDGDGDMNHSAMFLAHYAAGNIIWTLEGNSENAVRVKQRSFSLPIREGNVFRRLGHIKASMWE